MRTRPTRFAVVAATMAALGLGAGCANVLGVEDFTVLDAGDASLESSSSAESGADSDATMGPDTGDGDARDGKSAADAIDGLGLPTEAGDGKVVDGERDGSDATGGGDSATCLGGGACTPAECQVGQLACDAGAAFCSSIQSVTNGTLCGVDGGDAGDGVCNQGTCAACATGGDCSAQNSCNRSVYVCTTGSPVCTDAGNASEGSPCGTGMYCYGGVCSTCTVSAACTPTNHCHMGTVSSCSGGVPTCMDTGQAATDGASCGSNQVCSGGMCVACTANVACTPATTCHSGLTSCATGTSVCTDTGNLTNGTLCTGSNPCFQTYTCQAGTCTGSNPVSCSGGMTCVSGTCQCPSGTMSCGGTCINVMGDANNCGRCGHGCLPGNGGMCSAGVCQPIGFVTAGASNIVAFDTDGSVVVFADSSLNEIAQVSVPGGTPLVLSGGGQATNPDHVVLGSGNVYWTQADGNFGKGTTGQLNAGNIVGASCGTPTYGLVNAGSGGFDILTGALYSVALGLSGNPCLADTTTMISGTYGSSLSPKWAFGDIGNNAVVFGANNNGPPNAVIASQPGVKWVWDDGTYAYWATSEPAIRRARFSAPSGVSLVISPGAAVGGLTTDGTNVYYQISTGIYYVPVAGASSGTLLTNKAGTRLRYGAGAVFFLSGGVIYQIATP
jgi:hypothetical protein